MAFDVEVSAQAIEDIDDYVMFVARDSVERAKGWKDSLEKSINHNFRKPLQSKDL